MKLLENDKHLLEKYLSVDTILRYKSLQDVSGEIKITNTGMVSSGKSSLYNILIDRQDEFFKTGAARTTTTADVFQGELCEFVDTPGIDVTEEDDDLAYRTIMSSDLIMMIHNIKTGPLQRREVEWLEKIVQNINDPSAVKQRLIFVCSWKDAREKNEDYQEILNTIKQMVFDVTKVEIPFFDVSTKKYKAGVEKNADVLIESSNILQLKQYLQDYFSQYSTVRAELNKQQKVALCQDMKRELAAEKQGRTNECSRTREKFDRIFKDKMDMWNKIYSLYMEKKQEVDRWR